MRDTRPAGRLSAADLNPRAHVKNLQQTPKNTQQIKMHFIGHSQEQKHSFGPRPPGGGRRARLHFGHPKAELPVATDHAQRERPVPAEARSHRGRSHRHRLERQRDVRHGSPRRTGGGRGDPLTCGCPRWWISSWVEILPGHPVVAKRFSLARDHLRRGAAHKWHRTF